jgi:hypothetical protein
LLQTLEGHSHFVTAVVAGRGAARVGFAGQNRQVVGHAVGRCAADARGPFKLRQFRSLLARRDAAGVGVKRQHRQVVGRAVGGGTTDASSRRGSVNSVAFSPDGTLLASASGTAIELWDARSGAAL